MCNERDDKWFLAKQDGIVRKCCVKHEKCANIGSLVYKMQVRQGESLWFTLTKWTLVFLEVAIFV